MEPQKTGFYDRYWKSKNFPKEGNEFIRGIKRLISDEPIFDEVPVWGEIGKELQKREDFFGTSIRGTILDAGCGSGSWVFYLACKPQVKSAVGVDISKAAVGGCDRKVKEKKLEKKIKFIQASITDLPFKNKFFDVVFSLEVIEHIIDADRTFYEFNRVLKKGGYLGVSTIDFNFLKQIIVSLFFFEKYFDPRSPHIRFFTKKTLERLLNRNGFKIEKYQWSKSYFGLMPMGQIVLAKKIKDI